MEFEMSRFKQLFIEAFSGASFNRLLKSSEINKIGRGMAKIGVDFNASVFKKAVDVKQYRFSAARKMFTKFEGSESGELIVAINGDKVIALVAENKTFYWLAYASYGDLNRFTSQRVKSDWDTVRARSDRDINNVAACSLQIENLFNDKSTQIFVADIAGEVGDKRADRKANSEHKDELIRKNELLKRKVKMVSSEAYKQLNSVAKENGYKVERLYKNVHKYGNSEFVYIECDVYPVGGISNDNYTPAIHIDRKGKKLTTSIQTTSWGSLAVNDIDKVIDGLARAKKVAEVINNIKFEDISSLDM